MCLCVCVCVKDEKKKRGSQTLKSARIKKKKKKILNFKKKKQKKMLLSKIECEWGNNINVCGVELYIFIILRKSLFTKYTCTGLFHILTCCIHMCYLKCR